MCHYLTIIDLNTATGLTHDKFKGGSYSDGYRTSGPHVPVGSEAEAGSRPCSLSMSLDQPSSSLRPSTASQAEGTSTGLKVMVGAKKGGSGTKKARLTESQSTFMAVEHPSSDHFFKIVQLSQSTNGADDESEDGVRRCGSYE